MSRSLMWFRYVMRCFVLIANPSAIRLGMSARLVMATRWLVSPECLEAAFSASRRTVLDNARASHSISQLPWDWSRCMPRI